MAVLRPFKALRPEMHRVSQVASVPYDVINYAEALELTSANPWSFLHVSRSEVDLPLGTDPYLSEVYQVASENFQKLIRDCPMLREAEDSLYLYRVQMGDHEQVGIAGCFSIDEYESNFIKKHERTRREKEDDRTRHILELSAQTGPVFLTYQDVPEINAQMKKIQLMRPLYDFSASDGIRHSVWVISQSEALVALFDQDVSSLYIADGHHRAAAASRVRQELAKKNLKHQGNENYNFMFAVAFPSSQLKILPYHRVVKDLFGMNPSEFMNKVEKYFNVKQMKKFLPEKHEFGMYFQKQWYCLQPQFVDWDERLDVAVLQEHLLEPILGISDPRTDKRMDFVGGIRGLLELERIVDSKLAEIGFALHPTQVRDVMEVSDRGEMMPPKSTWFEPKLRDGLLCYCIGNC